MLNSFHDELVIAGHVEYGATRSWICQLDEWLVTQWILMGEETQRNKQDSNLTSSVTVWPTISGFNIQQPQKQTLFIVEFRFYECVINNTWVLHGCWIQKSFQTAKRLIYLPTHTAVLISSKKGHLFLIASVYTLLSTKRQRVSGKNYTCRRA